MITVNFIIPKLGAIGDYGTFIIIAGISFIMGIIIARLLIKTLLQINTKFLDNYLFNKKTNYFNIVLLIITLAFLNIGLIFFEFYQNTFYYTDSIYVSQVIPFILGFFSECPLPYENEETEKGDVDELLTDIIPKEPCHQCIYTFCSIRADCKRNLLK